MAKVPYGVKTLPKISIAWVGYTNVTDRQTDGWWHIANVKVSSRSLKTELNVRGDRVVTTAEARVAIPTVLIHRSLTTLYRLRRKNGRHSMTSPPSVRLPAILAITAYRFVCIFAYTISARRRGVCDAVLFLVACARLPVLVVKTTLALSVLRLSRERITDSLICPGSASMNSKLLVCRQCTWYGDFVFKLTTTMLIVIIST